MRKASFIPDPPYRGATGKQMEHYVNGHDRTDGAHPGIKSRCPICTKPTVKDLLTCESSPHGYHTINLDQMEINGVKILTSVCIWCKRNTDANTS